MRRLLYALVAVVGWIGLTVGPAFAGGWAVTTLDPLPAVLEAGRVYRIGYTVRQHGVTPVDVARFGGTTEIVLWSPDLGQQLRFPGQPDGASGHYLAEIRLPSAGRWSWQVTQGPFQPQPLGEIVVQAPPPPPAAQLEPVRAAITPPFLAPLLGSAWLASMAAMLFALRRERQPGARAGR